MGDVEDTVLHEAVRYGDVEEVEAALRDGFDANQIGLYEWGPLHEAAHNGEKEVLQLLLKYDGDPNQHDILRGRTAVHYAACEGHTECLKLLLKEGGRLDVLDNYGKTPLDIASTECRNILNTLKTKSTIKAKEDEVMAPIGSPEPPAYGSWSSISQSQDVEVPLSQSPLPSRAPSVLSRDSILSADQSRPASRMTLASGMKLQVDNLSQAGSFTDSDSISVLSENSSGNALSRRWASGKPVTLDQKLVLGNIQLSFEFNSKKATLKIRVWQLQDLALPPVDTSMISGIYVKSHLLPDKRASTKRKTDVRPAYVSDKDSSNPKQKSQPSSYAFNQGLIYTKVSPDVIQEKVIHIEVCIVQKFTRRSFIIATWNMPAALAVRRLIKEYYPLTAKISTSLPANMKIYPSHELSLERHTRPYHSNPGTRAPSRTSMNTERAISDGDLQHVIEIEELETSDDIFTEVTSPAVDRTHTVSIPGQMADEPSTSGGIQTVSIELHSPPPPAIKLAVPSDDDSEEETEFTEVKVVEARISQSASSAVTIPAALADTTLNDLPNLEKVVIEPKVHQSSRVKSDEVSVKMVPDEVKPERQVSQSKRFSWGSRRKSKEKSEVVERSASTVVSQRRGSSRSRSSDMSSLKSISPRSIGAASRPDTPSWDNYGEPPVFTMEPIDFEFDVCSKSPQLPMETHMDLPSVHGNFQPQAKQMEAAQSHFSRNTPDVTNSRQSLLHSSQQHLEDESLKSGSHDINAKGQTKIRVHDSVSKGQVNLSYERDSSDDAGKGDLEMYKMARRTRDTLVLDDFDESDIEEIHV